MYLKVFSLQHALVLAIVVDFKIIFCISRNDSFEVYMLTMDRQTDGQSDRWDKPVHDKANQYTVACSKELKRWIVFIICKTTK
jgi:hypothetical protein